MKEHRFSVTVSKPYTRCTGCEQLRTNLRYNLLVITLIVFWHIVIGTDIQDYIKKFIQWIELLLKRHGPLNGS
jgi:hypothetical protein